MTYIERVALAIFIIIFAVLIAGFILMGLEFGEIVSLAAIGAFIVAGCAWSLLRLIDYALGGQLYRQAQRHASLLARAEAAERVHSTRSTRYSQSR